MPDLILHTTNISESKKELVEQFLRKAKQIEFLIDSLPAAPFQTYSHTENHHESGDSQKKDRRSEQDGADFDRDLLELEKELKIVNEAYLIALTQAGT